MPELSRFFGIIIRMFVETGGQHQRPHFHAFYLGHILRCITRIEEYTVEHGPHDIGLSAHLIGGAAHFFV